MAGTTQTAERDGLASSGERPWLRLYPADIPHDLASPFETPLAAFEAVAGANLDRTALWYFDTPMSFGALSGHANALAAAWAGRVAFGDRVAILNQNTPATVIALLAAWRLGAAVIPLNPMLTARELTHYLADGEPAAIMVGAEQAAALADALASWGGSPVIAFSAAQDFLQFDGAPPAPLRGLKGTNEIPDGWAVLLDLPPAPAMFAHRVVHGTDLAFLTYTSGTTGRPKAALNTHANVAFNAEVYRRWLRLDADDVLYAAAPFSHVTGLVAHIAAGFAAGAPVVMNYRFDAATVLDLLARRGCTTTVAAITAYIALLDHPNFDAAALPRFTKLFSGGAPVAPAVVERWEAATGIYIHNAYGLTETTSPSHLVPFGQRAPVDPMTGSLSVGVPVPGTYCRVVDMETRETLPSGGEVGELLTAGPQVVAGYWRKPEESAAGFQDGWLRTGDLGRADADGWFFVVDRAKDMIVASGFKVWPREVEDTLLEHPGVSEAAVVGVPDAYRGEVPKAFVVARPGAAVTDLELRAFCRERLAAYKTPREIVLVTALPKTISGKVLRRELRDIQS